MEKKPVQEWREIILPALESKKSELRIVGYSDVTIDKLWDCLMARVWKSNPSKRLHEVIQDVFHLPPSVYMNFLTNEAYNLEDDLMSSIAAVTGKSEDRI